MFHNRQFSNANSVFQPVLYLQVDLEPNGRLHIIVKLIGSVADGKILPSTKFNITCVCLCVHVCILDNIIVNV